MLEEEARRWSMAHALRLFCVVHACESRATFPATGHGGWGC